MSKDTSRKFLDANHPMFRKAWVRWATTLFPLAWGALELYWGNPGWAAIFGGAPADQHASRHTSVVRGEDLAVGRARHDVVSLGVDGDGGVVDCGGGDGGGDNSNGGVDRGDDGDDGGGGNVCCDDDEEDDGDGDSDNGGGGEGGDE